MEAALTPKNTLAAKPDTKRAAALELPRDPELVDRIARDVNQSLITPRQHHRPP